METFMDEAFMEARHALAVGEVPVGCVFVWDNEIIARSRNYVNATKNATRHAEFVCIDQVLEYCKSNGLDNSEVFKQISVVVTVEPCIMCSAALHTLGVKEILYGCANDRFGGKTVVNVAEVVGTNLPIRGGIRAAEAMDLLKEFYKGVNPSAPVPNTRK
ncbi:tRNA-specific adenosine deaminase 2-like isoform X1 [Teleopsis dalmanni]|uniref:tRNA-specific adenosine deaminase 2-like isoform X1 n=1 Tax=Teleopsis dalmanni TaxID=139649 RepID=UPI0018CD0E66|nr:tRNA-specific adenosine deaminase 2-like isoform X1 [Teleopsis dalmanni]XP_037952278.1 tRNA-specific adenosine deaminase 2-like isoform X1 [Teleopsis dalmanni]